MKRRLFSGLMAFFMVLTLIPGPVPAYAAETEMISGDAMETEKAAAAAAIRAANTESLTPLEETQAQDAEEAAPTDTPSDTEEAALPDTPSEAEEETLPDTPSEAEEETLPDTPSDTQEAALPDTPSDAEEAAPADTPSDAQEATPADTPSDAEEATLPGILFDPEEESLPDEASDESDDIAQILAVDFKLIFGDIDGDGAITQADADMLSSAVSNTVTLTDAQKAVADVDGDGEVTFRDTLALQQYVDKTIDVLPVFEVKKLAAQGYCGKEGVNVMWTLDKDGILTVSGVGAMCNSPAWKDTRNVDKKSQIKGVVIESGVTSIGENAFQSCSALETLSISGSVTSVGSRAFYGCLQLTNVVIPEGVTTIGYSAFYGCRNLESMSLSSTLTSIASDAFYYCGEYVADGFTLIVPRDSYARTYAGNNGRQHAFADDPTAVMLRGGQCGEKLYWMIYKSAPATLVLEGSGIMSNWTSNGVPWASYRSSITTVTLPKGVTTIGNYAFYECAKLTTIVLPDTVTSIGSYAFNKCSALKALTIPASVTSVGSYAFSGCDSLALTVYRDSYGRTYAGSNAIRHVLSDAPTAVILRGGQCGDKLWWLIYETAPATLVLEGSGAMNNWGSSSSNSMPWASYKTTLTAVTIPKGVTSIGSYAFYECSKLTTIAIPDTVTSIGNYAFSNCAELKALTIPATVTSIGNYAFSGCDSLTLTVYRDSTGRTYAGSNAIRHALADDPTTFILRGGPCGDKLWWSVYESAPATLVLEGSGAMNSWGYNSMPWYSYRSSITAVTIPKGVTSIGNYAFYECSKLETISIPDTVTSIGQYAFNKCSALKTLTIPATVTSVGNYAFSNCPELALTVYRDSYGRTYASNNIIRHALADDPTAVITRDGKCGDKLWWNVYEKAPSTLVFEGSGDMTNWSSSNNIPWSSYKASITAITIPKGITSIGGYAFHEFSALTTIAIPDTVTSIGSYAFNKCAALKAVTIPATVTSIGSSAFANCSELTLTVYRDSVGRTYAGENRIPHVLADDSDDPKTVILGSGPCGDQLWWSVYETAPGTLVFEGSGAMNSWSYNTTPWYSYRSSITAVTVPKGVTSIGNYAFNDCSKLTTIAIPDTVTSIGNYAFNNCAALKALTIPATVTSIGSSAFTGCPDLTLTVYRDSYGRTYVGSAGLRHAFADDPTAVIIKGGQCGDKLWWAIYEKNPATLVLEGSGDMYNWSSSSSKSAPWNAYKASITAVTVPKGVTSIGNYAFYEFSALTTIAIPDAVTSIGSYAFYKCAALKALTIPAGVTSIGSSAFANCPDLILTVSRDSYGRTYASNSAIRHALADDPKAVITRGGKCGEKLWWAIYESAPATLVLEGSGDMNSWGSGGAPWYSYKASITAVTLPKGVTSIGNYAFYDCSKLTAIAIPDTVTSIGNYAFNNCAALKSLTIPTSVTSIGNYAFSNCPELTLTVYRDSYGRTYAGNNGLRHVLADASNSPIIKGGQCGETLWWAIYESAPTTLVLEGSGAMNNWSSSSSNSTPWASYKTTLTAVTIPKGVTSIGKCAFYECSKLTTIAIPESVTSIGDYAFYKCAALTTLTIPATVTSIENSAFSGCDNLILTVPRDSQARIYAGSHGLRHVLADDPKAVITRGGQCGDKLWWAIYESDPATLVLEGSGDMSDYDYYTGAPWKSYKSQFTAVTIPAGVTSIGKYAFYEFTKLTSVTIPANATSIGASAFRYCSALEALTIPATVASIGDYAFSNCDKLTLTVFRDTPGMTYAINAGIAHKVQGESRQVVADGKCGASLYWILLGDGTLEMTGNGDMYDYGTDYSGNPNMPWASLRAQIKTLSIPAGVTRVGNYAFYGCAALTKAALPASVDSIGQRAFMDCAALTEVTTSASKIESRAFYGCAALSKVTLADGLQTLGDEVFSNCASLSALSVPQSVASIGKSVFSGCEKLKLTVPPDSYVRTFAIANGFPHYVSNAPELLIEACGTCGSTLQWLFYANGTLSFEGSGAMYDYRADSSQNYRTTAPWYPYSQRIAAVNFSDQMTRVGNYAFYGDTYYSNDNRCTKLTALTLPASVTSIGDYAFYHCAELKTLNLPNGALSIGKNAFDGCSALTSVILPKTLESIGANAFADCGALVLTVYTGSYAKDYVMKNGLKYVTSDNPDSLVLDSGSCGDKLYWEFYADGTLKFEGSGAMNDYSNSWRNENNANPNTNAPWYEYRAQITKVAIPEGVTKIGKCAFYGNVEYATDYRFTALESVTLPASLTAIGEFAFYGCVKLKDFKFPDALSEIGRYAFYGCEGLNSLTIPKDLKTIGADAFSACPNLTLTVYPNSYAASYVLQNNVRHKVFGSDDPVTVASGQCGQTLNWMLYDNGTLKFQGSGAMRDYSRQSDSEPRTTAPWYVNKDQIVEVIIPEGVTKIGNYAFYGSTYYATDWRFAALKKVTLPASLESIGAYAFYGCANLETPALPAKLGSVGSYAFAECAALTKLTVPQNLNSIEQNAFADCPQLLLSVLKDSYGRTYALQNGLRHATLENPDAIVAGSGFADSKSKLYWLFYEDGRLVFEGEGAIKDYSIENHRTSAPWHKYSDQITSVTIPNTVTGIGACAFYGSIYYGQDSRFGKVSGIDIPDSVTSIGSSAFQNCTGLTALTLSPYVGKIGSNAFAGCQNLTLKVYKDTDARVYAVRNGLKHTVIETKRTAVISGECGAIGSPAIYWLLYTDGKLEFEGSGAMRNFTGNNYTTNAPWQPYRDQITAVVIPDGMTSIGSYAFYGIQYYSKDYRFSSLSSVTLPESVNNIGEYAFSGCAALSTFNLPDKVTAIKNGVFSGCVSLYGLTMLEGVKSIGNEAFSGCAGLSLLLIPESVNSIGKNAFAKCRALTLQVHENSYALRYAQEQNLRHEIYESGVVVPGTPPDADDPTVAPVTPVSPAQPFDVTRDAYAFVNKAESFGYTGSLTGNDYPIAYKPSFQMIFGDSVAGKSKWKQTTMGQWGGNCNGFSSTAALMYAGIIAAASSGKETVSALGVDDKLSGDFDVKTFIEAMQVSQYTDSFAKDYQGNKRTAKQLKESGLSLNNLIETVAADVAKGKCDIIAVGKQGVGAHALLAYRMEQVSANEYTMYVYDCNFPGQIRTFKLTADSSGLFTHWTYNMGSYGDWGTEGADGPRCFISFIPFDTIRHIWDNRGNPYQSKEMLSVNVGNLSIVDSSNKEVARLEDGNLVTDSAEIFEVPELSMTWSDTNSIYLPKDLYTIRATDDSQELQASMTDRNLEASVTTSSNAVTFAVDDASRENTVFIDGMSETDTYDVKLSSSFIDSEYETLSISGTGSAGMTSDTISISGAKDSLALSSNITYTTLKINETEQQAQYYTIQASVNDKDGGSIAPSGDVKVLPGASQSFTFVPKVGYKFDYIEVDGVKLENLTISGTYTFTLAEEDTDRAITAYFSKAYEIGEAAFDPASRTVNVTNLLSLTDAVLTAMAFDGNGKFVTCATKNVSADAETASVTFATELPENCSVKLVLTDKDMKPLCSPFPVKSA